MSAFAEKNGDARAVGNGNLNGRGDVVDARGNVKIPSQNISRAVANLQNNQSKQVSLKADATINPVQNTPLSADPTIVSTRDIVNADGTAATEVEYSDGSIAVVPKAPQTPTSL
jgi:hypothetical protein